MQRLSSPQSAPQAHRPRQKRSLLARGTALATAVAVGSATLLTPGSARAEEVSPTAKGIVGGALLGGEIVMIPMSLFHVKSGWAYAIGGGLGAVGGGVGGYFIETAGFSSDGRVPMYMLAGGMALVIPTVILTLNATRYQPAEGATEDHAPTNAPAADPGRAGGSVVVGTPPASTAPAAPAPAPATPAEGGDSTAAPAPAPEGGGGAPEAPQSLFDVWAPQGTGTSASLRMTLPAPEVRPVYSLAEQKKFGVPGGQTEVRMPVFRVTF